MITFLERDTVSHPSIVLDRESSSRPCVQTLNGVTSFRDEGAVTTMSCIERITLTPTGVEHRIGELGASSESETIRSGHPEVVRYLRQVNAARAAHQRRLVSRGCAS